MDFSVTAAKMTTIADFIPVVSTASNLATVVAKAAFNLYDLYDPEFKWSRNPFICHIRDKSLIDTLVLMVPIINIPVQLMRVKTFSGQTLYSYRFLRDSNSLRSNILEEDSPFLRNAERTREVWDRYNSNDSGQNELYRVAISKTCIQAEFALIGGMPRVLEAENRELAETNRRLRGEIALERLRAEQGRLLAEDERHDGELQRLSEEQDRLEGARERNDAVLVRLRAEQGRLEGDLVRDEAHPPEL